MLSPSSSPASQSPLRSAWPYPSSPDRTSGGVAVIQCLQPPPGEPYCSLLLLLLHPLARQPKLVILLGAARVLLVRRAPLALLPSGLLPSAGPDLGSIAGFQVVGRGAAC